MTMQINAAATGNRYLDAFGKTITDAADAMDKMITDAAKDPVAGEDPPLRADHPLFGLQYAGHKFKRDTATNFVSSAQQADNTLVKGIYDRL